MNAGNMPSEEMLFLLEKQQELDREYGGKYIAIWKQKVIAVGRSISEVYRITREMKVEKPLVTYIPGEGEEAFLI